MRYGMVIDLKRCSGCKTCSVVCKVANNIPNNIIWNRVLTEGADVVAMLVTGPLAPFFWTQIACMVLACVILFVPRLRTKGGVVVASALVIAGVFCKRCQILMGGFQIPNIEFADVANQMTITHWDSGMSLLGYQGLVYWPTPLEFGVAAGVVALGGFLLLLGLKYLPLHLKEKVA